MPVALPPVAPAARAARGAAGEALAAPQRLQPGGERRALATRDRRGKADMVEPTLGVVQAEQQRADLPPRPQIAEAADHAVGGAPALHLHHRVTFARAVRAIEPLGHYPVLPRRRPVEPR